MGRLPSNARFRFLRSLGGWWKDNKIATIALSIMHLLGWAFDYPPLATLFVSSQILADIPLYAKLLPIAAFIIVDCAYYKYEYRKKILIDWLECNFRSRTYADTILISETEPSELVVWIGLGPSVRKWTFRLKCTSRCVVDKVETRSEYNPNNTETCGWATGPAIEDRVEMIFHLKASSSDASGTTIITMEILTNKDIDAFTNSGGSWEDAKMELLLEDFGYVV